MPDSVTDMVYWVMTGVLAICLAYIGWSLKEGFTHMVSKLDQLDISMKALASELQEEREERRVSYTEVLGKVSRLEGICAERHKD